MFAERLNAVIEISGATNTMIGHAVGIDSSYIGRLRNGKRPLPKIHPFLFPMCEYLIRRFSKEYQFIALRNLTGIPGETFSEHEWVKRLVSWLIEADDEKIAIAGQFISSFSSLTQIHPDFGKTNVPLPSRETAHLSYYGDDGKRNAVERFFLDILRRSEPCTLLLFSDESFEWLYAIPGFSRRWQELFIAVLLRGNRVKIVHTVSRGIDEMLEGVNKWLPIYMSGAVEPYYYPRLRDGLFQRTMFIAEDTAAIISSSIRQNSNGLTLYLDDPKDIAALTREYQNFLALCKPLMRIYHSHQGEAFFQSAKNLFNAEGDAIYYSKMPPLFSIPEHIAAYLSKRSGLPDLFRSWKESLNSFTSPANVYNTTVVILTPELVMKNTEQVHLPLCEMLKLDPTEYTSAFYKQHIENLQRMEKTDKRLKIIFKNEMTDNILLYAREHTGTLVATSCEPNMAFSINEPNMSNAFWEYLSQQLLPSNLYDNSRQNVIP